MTPYQTQCRLDCSLNGQRRPYKNVGEMFVCDVKEQLSIVVRRYMNLILEYLNQPTAIIPHDVINGLVMFLLISLKSNLNLSLDLQIIAAS